LYSIENDDKADDDIYTKPLVDDIERLSKILSNIVRTESNEVHNLYDQLIGQALSRSQGDSTALNKMKAATKDVTPEIALGVTRAFTQTLNLINAAEVHHRMRYLRELDFEVLSPLPKREDSMAGAIESVLSGTLNKEQSYYAGSSDLLERKKMDIYNTFMNQKVEIVYTAHPTEVNRRTMLSKYRYVSEMLATLDRKDLSLYERMQTEDSLRRVIASLWGSDEIRREKPTPQQEARGGLAILESGIFT
jgi:phosphoenolpyruvate carboxylase